MNVDALPRLATPIWDDEDFALHRFTTVDSRPMLALVAVSTLPSSEIDARLRQSHAIGVDLDASWAAIPIALRVDDGRPTLLLEDPGGELLAHRIGQVDSLTEVLRIAVGLAASVRKMHERRLVHGDLRPCHMLVDPRSGDVHLTGFGIASRLPPFENADAPRHVPAGAAYAAPERSGRERRAADPRSDLYAVGVSLYELVSGRLPFEAKTTADWLYAHIAREPAPLVGGRFEIPTQLAALVTKLLAKSPDERYQSAAGLEADLRICRSQWEQHGRLDPFLLAARDASQRPKKPQRLYGRAVERDALVDAANRVTATGAPEIVVVSGPSGAGKSTLIRELVKSLPTERTLLAEGKFDRVTQELPFATLASVLKGLVRHILARSDADVRTYRAALAEAVGDAGGLVIDFVPEMALLLGPALPVHPSAPDDAEARFRGLMVRVVSAIAQAETPLVLTLDDLQWADRASLALLRDLTRERDTRHLLIVGAYRVEDVGKDHDLATTLANVHMHGVPIVHIALGPLTDDEATELVADALQMRSREVWPLVQPLIAKTGGNPFFLVELLMALVDEGLLAWDLGAVRWVWDLPRIQARRFTDNIVDLMTARVKRLPERTRDVLKVLASFGISAELTSLASVCETSGDATARLLEPAEAEGLVARSGTKYTFLHDRVQEAAHALLPEHERPAMQLRIARLLFATLQGEARERSIFELTAYFLRGAALIETSCERAEVAELTLAAARRAMSARAYAAASSYLAAGAKLLPDDALASRYELTFAIGYLHADCLRLKGEPIAAEARFARLAMDAATPLDRARVTCRLADVYLVLDRHDDCVRTCIAHLATLGFALSAHPTDEELGSEHARFDRAMRERTVESLAALPPMVSPELLEIMGVLVSLIPSAGMLGARLRECAALRMASLSIEHGRCQSSAVAFAEVARLLASHPLRNHDARAFGRLALALVDEHGCSVARGRVYHLVADDLLPWTEPLARAQTLMRRAFDVAADAGDLAFAGLSLIRLVSLSLASGEPLERTRHTLEEALEYGRRNRVTLLFAYLEETCCLLARHGSDPRGESRPSRLESSVGSSSIADGWLWLRRLAHGVVERNETGTAEAMTACRSKLSAGATVYDRADYHYYAALGEAARGHTAAAQAHHEALAGWATDCPASFASRAALVGGELARLQGRILDAERLYEDALDAATASGALHEQALAAEHAAAFYAERRLGQCASAYRQRAASSYRLWGALSKASALERPSKVAAPSAPLSSSEGFDLTKVIEFAKAVSSEIILDRLVERLVALALEHAGATRGMLILRTRDGHRIEAEATAGTNRVAVRFVRAPVIETDLPLTLFRYVLRTRQLVSLADDAGAERFRSDGYFAARHVRSVLCLPLVKQTELIGVLYLENDLTPNAFTSDRVAVLTMLAAQAAISLENARLYEDLKRVDRHLAEAQTLSHTGSFGWNTVDASISLSDEARKIYGFAKGTRHTAEDVLRIVHPEDRARTARLASAVSTHDQDFVNDFRIITGDGTLKHVRTVGHALMGDGGLEYVGAVMDTTASKQAEAELQRAHLLLAGAQRLSHTGSMGWNVATGEAWWSDETYAIYGVPPGTKASPERVLESVHPDDIERVTRQVEQVISEGKDWVSEFRMVMPDGAVKHVHVVARVAAWEQGNREYIGAIRDVTRERLAEERLRASERRYAVTLASIAEGLIATDGEARVTYMNPAAETLLGIANENALGQPIDEVFRVVKDGRHRTVLSRTGRRIPVEERRSPIVQGDGDEPGGVVIVFHDVTDRLLAEGATALRLANDRLQLALRGSNVGIWDFDLSDERIEGATSHLVNIWESLGYDREAEELDDSAIHPERWHPEDLLELRSAMNAHIRGETSDFAFVARNVHQDGMYRWRVHRGKVLRDAHHKAIRFIGTSVDITDRKHLEEELVRAKELAESANQAKDEFLANVSHEIRTPMNAIFGMTGLMLEDPLPEVQRARLVIARSATDNLLAIVDDLLDFSKLEAKMIELDASELSLRGVVDDCVATLALRASQKGLTLDREVEPDVPDVAVGDAGRVRQVLINLLGNAVKFTDRGGVHVHVALVDASPTRFAVRFAVRDSGIGIPADKQAGIFQAFAQQDMSTTRNYGGTGLGLTIASHLAAAMGGSITVESTPGHGSLFTFVAWFARLSDIAPRPSPAARSDDAAAAGRVPTSPSGLRILVAEDNPINAEVMLQIIARRGHHAVLVERGDLVLDRIVQGGVDLLFLDLHMPGLDGFQVIERVRASERGTDRHLPVIALTARSRAVDRERCLESGMDDFMSKPIEAGALWAIVDRLMDAKRTKPSPPARASSHLGIDASVLLGACDGDPLVLSKICGALERQLPLELAQAAAGLDRGDALALRESAHKLCGMLAVVSTSASNEASALEELAARGALREAAVSFEYVRGLTEALVAGLSTLSIEGLRALAAKAEG